MTAKILVYVYSNELPYEICSRSVVTKPSVASIRPVRHLVKYIYVNVFLCQVHIDFELMFFSTNIQPIDQQKNCFHFSSSGYIKPRSDST